MKEVIARSPATLPTPGSSGSRAFTRPARAGDEGQGRIHTSAATVIVLPEAEEVDSRSGRRDSWSTVYARAARAAGRQHDRSAVRIHTADRIDRTARTNVADQEPREGMKVLRSRLSTSRSRRKRTSDRARASCSSSGGPLGQDPHLQLPQGRVTDTESAHALRIDASWRARSTSDRRHGPGRRRGRCARPDRRRRTRPVSRGRGRRRMTVREALEGAARQLAEAGIANGGERRKCSRRLLSCSAPSSSARMRRSSTPARRARRAVVLAAGGEARQYVLGEAPIATSARGRPGSSSRPRNELWSTRRSPSARSRTRVLECAPARGRSGSPGDDAQRRHGRHDELSPRAWRCGRNASSARCEARTLLSAATGERAARPFDA
jgi:hypothetical protein